MSSIEFCLVDVFAEEPLAGNQLAVFLDAASLSSEQMQRIAREMNFSETTFVESVESSTRTCNIRIFTPKREVPFAGHPTLGTAFVIQQALLRAPVANLVINLKAGPIPVEFTWSGSQVDVLWMQQPQPAFGRTLDDKDSVCAALGLKPLDIDSRFPIQEASTGLPFLIVPLTSLQAVKKARVSGDACSRLIDTTEAKAILIFAHQTYSPHNDLNVRVFADYYGTPEDPATGSANGALAGYLVHHRYLGNHHIHLRVEQGYEIGRPSLLLLRGEQHPTGISVKIGGKVQAVANGHLQIPVSKAAVQAGLTQ